MQAIIDESELNNLCQALLKADTDIKDIILFGSFAYSPSIAKDIDLLITTKKKKSSDSHFLSLKDFPENIDLITREPEENINE